MNAELTVIYEAKARDLRAHLKTWENDWARTHRGCKPGRQDIKDNPDIAEKYKEYNKTRDILAGKAPPPPAKDDQPRPKKRTFEPTASQTPQKRSKRAETPHREHYRDEDLMNSPAISRKLFSPAKVTSLGPTPQKDGRVLGLFDLLVERELGTPSHKTKDAGTRPDNRHETLATPSKRTGRVDMEGLGRTPMSASKRHQANAVMTPMKGRAKGTGERTPLSVSKLQFDTPAFLKRHALPTLDENDGLGMPVPLKLPRKPMIRGLSEIVASLRRVEEETLDDDLEALREAENEEAGIQPVKQPIKTPAETDSQARRLPLGGFDDEGLYDSPEEDKARRNGNPLAVYKKKAPKRTTRRVNIKPVWNPRPCDMGESSGGQEPDEADTLETRPRGQAEEPPEGRDLQETKAAKKPKPQTAKEGPIKKTARKVNELAHANFQRLKLRNSGAKGGPGQNSRFRRRR